MQIVIEDYLMPHTMDAVADAADGAGGLLSATCLAFYPTTLTRTLLANTKTLAFLCSYDCLRL